jgi:hypothetical protein
MRSAGRDWHSCSASRLLALRVPRPRRSVFRIRVFQSVTSTKDGTLYVGSFNLGGMVKAAPGGKAEQFIKPRRRRRSFGARRARRRKERHAVCLLQ